MTSRAARLARLEGQAAQREYLDRGRMPLALERLSWEELCALEEAVQAAGGAGLPVHPWDSPPADLGEGKARCWTWARQMVGKEADEAWSAPPLDALAVFAAEARKLEGQPNPEARYAWAGWALLSALAAVMLEEGTRVGA